LFHQSWQLKGALMPDDSDKVRTKEKEMPFLEHLEELRWRLIKAAIAIIVGMIICLFFSQQILDILILPTHHLDTPLVLQVLKVQGMFMVKLEVGFFGGLVIALPLVLVQFWRFISPGLIGTERRYFVPLIASSTILFLIGLSFAYFIILPLAIEFFIGLATGDIKPNIAIDFYIGFVLRILVVFGFVFELPIISYFLAKIGLLTPAFMRKYRRHAIVIIFAVAAVLTPPDVITQILLGVPLMVLYEFSIVIAGVVERNKLRKAEQTEQQTSDQETDKNP
jgi:sec-independent protein translocase protein TatC